MKLREARQMVRRGGAEKLITDIEKKMEGIPIPSDQLEFIKSAFAEKIGIQSDLNKYLKDAQYLAAGLPRETFMLILLEITRIYDFYYKEKVLKDQHNQKAKELKALKKTRDRKLEKYNQAIKIISSLNPDLSRFDKAYLLKLAQESTDKAFTEQKENIEKDKIIRTILSGNVDEPIKKGYMTVRRFIHKTYAMIRKNQSTLTDNAICSRLALLLTRLTDEKYIRQNVQNILARKMKTPHIPAYAK